MSAETELLKLATERFTNLSPAEEKLFRAAAKGEQANFSAASDEENDPSHADKWPAERTLNADRIAWLCTDPAASKLVTHRGIIVAGAQVNGILNLEWANITFPLFMQKCVFSGSVILRRGYFGGLYLIGTHIKDLQADGAEIRGSVFLRDGFKAEGAVQFPGATIAADLDCAGGQFINANVISLNADGAKIGGSVFLRNVKTEGVVRLVGATIALALDCSGGQFANANAIALAGDGVKIGGAFFLRNVKTEGEVRFLGATITRDLDCTDGQFINTKAIALNADGVKIGGAFFLRNVRIEGEVRFLGATITRDLDCTDGQFINTKAIALNADGVKIGGSVYLRNGFKAEGEVRLLGANIALDLDCSGGQFINAKAIALNADVMKIGGSVYLRNVKAEGTVRLIGATTALTLDCSGGQFINTNPNSDSYAFSAVEAKIGGSVLFNDIRAEGAVQFVGATIGGILNCENADFNNAKAVALGGDRVKVGGSVYLRNKFKAKGAVRLVGASITLDFDCVGGQFTNVNAIALAGDGVKVGGSVYLRNGFKAEGEVRLLGANIALDLDCEGGQFTKAKAVALHADGVKISNAVYLRNGFKAEGEVRLLGATIARDLDCSAGQFINANAIALNADGVKINGAVYLRNGFKAEGEVRLIGATVALDLDCSGGQLVNTNLKADSYALQADGVKINGSVYLRSSFEVDGKLSFMSAYVARHFQWRDVKSPEKVVLLDLRSAKVGTLWDEEKSWPKAGNLFLNGFVYDEIQHLAPTDAKSRIDWLKRQPAGQFLPEPYEQLAGALRKMGHENEADKVMIEKNDDIARRIAFYRPGRWLQFLFKLFVGYGYRPWRAFKWSLLIIAIGMLLFSSANRAGIMTPTKENAYVSNGVGTQRLSENYPRFNSFIYSLEMFTPLLKLEMGDYWQPNANRSEQLAVRGVSLPINGSLLRDYLWFHIILGWVLTTLWVGGLTGLVKK